MNDKCCLSCAGRDGYKPCPFDYCDGRSKPNGWNDHGNYCNEYAPLPDKPGKKSLLVIASKIVPVTDPTLLKSLCWQDECERLNKGQFLPINTELTRAGQVYKKTGRSEWAQIMPVRLRQAESTPVMAKSDQPYLAKDVLAKALDVPTDIPDIAVYDNKGQGYPRYTIIIGSRVYSCGEMKMMQSNGPTEAPSLYYEGTLVKITDEGLLIYNRENIKYPVGSVLTELPAELVPAIQSVIKK